MNNSSNNLHSNTAPSTDSAHPDNFSKNNQDGQHSLGIDIGSVSIAVVEIDANGNFIKGIHRPHHGAPLSVLAELLQNFDLQHIRGIGKTGVGAASLPMAGVTVNTIVAGVEAIRQVAPDVRNVISIGGGSFSLARLSASGNFQRSTMNSACASGTGAFLDQQALRLQIPPLELASRANEFAGNAPAVATRCAVFAKSDMIHLQQEGYSVEAIAAGLCCGLGRSTVDGLLGGHVLTGKTAIIGGVAKNSIVVDAVRQQLDVETYVPDSPELASAHGAALVALHDKDTTTLDNNTIQNQLGAAAKTNDDSPGYLRPELTLKLSQYPSFDCHDKWIDEDNSEIALVKPQTGKVTVSLGIDIGSTSTKAALLDLDNNVIAWIYRKTAGDPIRATQRVLRAVRRLTERGGFELEICGVGTTGSGRKLIGAIVGADLALNEITAHAKAAVFLDPLVDTIIELGGQDAKFTQLQNGMVYNSIMNYVCAAGTGSFIEEQALKLDIPLGQYADFALGKTAPRTSDRCTVYMERDLDLLLARGWNKDQVAAAVLHSVRDNYLNKVVGGLHIGDHIYFQGATARNKALVAAFEAELQKPIHVSPFCHITGALGMCLLVRERLGADWKSPLFRGLDFADAVVEVESETCKLCHNDCALQIIRTGNDVLAWGMKCGRDYGDKKVKTKDLSGYKAWRERETIWLGKNGKLGEVSAERTVGVPRSLATYGYWPFWREFLRTLDLVPVLSGRGDEDMLRQGVEISTAEYCAPVAMSHGQVKKLLSDERLGWVLVPHMLREPVTTGFTDAHFCCYVQAHPSVLKSLTASALPRNGRILSPVVQLGLPDSQLAEIMANALQPLGASSGLIRQGLKAGRAAMQQFNQESIRIGEAAIAKLEGNNALGLVCIGRPYNTLDSGLTLDIPRKMAELGYTVLFQDMLPMSVTDILPEHANMYWHYGQKILAAASWVAKHPRLFGVYFTNFMCGPDSYITTYFKDIMGKAGKPYLALQFDGHGADAGYLTRVEAALESFHSYSKIPRPQTEHVKAAAVTAVEEGAVA